jgi:hypothetical protein
VFTVIVMYFCWTITAIQIASFAKIPFHFDTVSDMRV